MASGDVKREVLPQDPHRCHLFRSDELRALLEQHGLAVTAISASNSLATGWESTLAGIEGTDVGQIANALASMPSAGLPRACRTTAALEATYRLLSNPRVEPQMILEPHLAETRKRADGEGALLAIHYTTEFAFGGETRKSLGRTNSHQPGFFAHVTLGVRASDREPLGVLGCRTWARHHKPTPKKERRTARYTNREDKESNRWRDAVYEVEERYDGVASLIHVVDREGDQYRLMSRTDLERDVLLASAYLPRPSR